MSPIIVRISTQAKVLSPTISTLSLWCSWIEEYIWTFRTQVRAPWSMLI